jgi:peptidoglycan/LPS O-acetylase OafA/YrhL
MLNPKPQQAHSISFSNNFDMIRLIAALQVAVAHAASHFEITDSTTNAITYFLRYFPGVKIFFFISGFLIYWSFDRNSSNLRKFYTNRALRIFPGLWVCVLLTTALLVAANPSILDPNHLVQLGIWFVGQVSFFQFYTPDVLRFWGVGTPNGSLWTIAVELQFYLLVPVFYTIIQRTGKRAVLLTVLFLVTLGLNVINYYLNPESMVAKLYTVSVIPYLIFFFMGTLLYLYWPYIESMIKGRFMWWSVATVLFIILTGYVFKVDYGEYFIHNIYGMIATVLLLGLTFSAAFSNTKLSATYLKGNDISYGIYIYHMVIVNVMYHYGSRDNLTDLAIFVAVTIIIAYLSWITIERPALKLKEKKK